MRQLQLVTWGLAALLTGQGVIAAGEVRYIEKDGVTYRETQQFVRRPVAETRWEERKETVYREQYTTELREAERKVYTPVTEYQYEPRLHGWWNPFRQPEIAYHLVPRTRWDVRTETVRSPVSYREYIPEARVVRVPVRSLGFVEEPVTTRVAVGPAATSRPLATGIPPANVTERTTLGGISRLESDPPRYGTGAPAPTVIRR